VQEAQAHPVPLPFFAGQAGAVGRDAFAFRRQAVDDRQRTPHRAPAAGVVGVAMAGDGHVEPAHAQRMQRRHHHPLAGIVGVADRRAHVVEQRVPLRAQQHRRTLPDVEHLQLELARRRQHPRRPQQRQPQQQRQRLARRAARQQQPERPEHGQRQREPPGFRQPPQGQTGFVQPFEPGPRQVERGRGQPPGPGRGAGMHRVEQGSDQGQRHHHQAPPGHRQQVGERSGKRGLVEQHHGQRQQPDAGHPLRAEQPAQRMLGSLRQAPQQPGHAGETQPEAGTEQRQGIDQADRDRGQCQRVEPVDRPPRQPCAGDHRDHQYRADRGQLEASDGGIAKAAEQCRCCRGLWTRQPPPKPRQQPPQRMCEQRDEAGDHADVEPGDRDQMGQAVGPQHFPVALVQAPGIADRQCAHEALGVRCHRSLDPRGDPCPPGVDSGRWRKTLGRIGRAHVTGGGDARSQCVLLGIEAARIAQPPRRAQTGPQRPAGTGFHLVARTGPGLHRPLAIPVTPPAAFVIPRQPQQAAAQLGIRRGAGIHAQQEARALGSVFGETDHQADDVGIHVRLMQLPRQGGGGMQARQAEPECEGSRKPPAAADAQHERESCSERGSKPWPWRKCRQRQAGADAGEQGDGDGGWCGRRPCRWFHVTPRAGRLP
jgi:hypothetical protein